VSLAGRVDMITGIGLCALLGLGARLYALSGTQHADLRVEAEARSRRAEIQQARRGPVVARDGSPLAVDRPRHDVKLDLPALDPSLELVTPLAWSLRISRAEALQIVRRARRRAKGLGEETLDLAAAPLADSERVHRILRRRRHLWPRVERGGVVIATRSEYLVARDQTLARLAPLLDVEVPALTAQVEDRVDAIHGEEERDARIHLWREPLVLVEGASASLILSLSERAFELPGLSLEKRFERSYPRGDLAVHAIGYLGAPSADEVRRDLKAGLLLDADRSALGLLPCTARRPSSTPGCGSGGSPTAGSGRSGPGTPACAGPPGCGWSSGT
jgi:cell division protein FtsI/penicillin-binding protein 2